MCENYPLKQNLDFQICFSKLHWQHFSYMSMIFKKDNKKQKQK